MCTGTCKKCNSCLDLCNCGSKIPVCKPKKKCEIKIPANCIEELHEYLYDTLEFGDCLFPTLEVINGQKRLKININQGCVNNFPPSNCTPQPIAPTIVASTTEITTGNKAVLTVSNFNGIVNWFNESGNLIGSGISIEVSAGIYYAKSLTACGYSANSNIVNINLITVELYTASRSATFTKECLPGCISTSVVFTKSYTASTQIGANNLASTDTNFNLEGQAFAEQNATCNCNYCGNILTWTNPILSCVDNQTTINISVTGNGTNPVEFYDYSLAGNTPYNPAGWSNGATLNSYTSSTSFDSDGSLHYFKARLKNCSNYIDGVIATCNIETMVYTATRTTSFQRNNCASGCTPSIVPFTKTYTSSVSQQTADNLALNDTLFATEGEAYANANGTCTNCCIPPVSVNVLGLNTVQVGTNNIYTLENNNVGVSYIWSSGLGVSLTNNTTNSVTFNAPAIGVYTLQCIISNGCGSVTVTKQITVQTGVVTPSITIVSNNPAC